MNEIFGELRRAVKALYGLDVEPEVTLAPANIEADYSSNVALKLAKKLHRAPMEIAGEIKAELERGVNEAEVEGDGTEQDLGGTEQRTGGMEAGGSETKQNLDETKEAIGRMKVEVSAPGFVNFISPDEYFLRELAEFDDSFEKNISQDEYEGKTVICEFSDPNPFKVLHVGHLYTSIVGDAIARLFSYAGAKVVRANFGGDVGLHVAKTIYALAKKVGLDLGKFGENSAGAEVREDDGAAADRVEASNTEAAQEIEASGEEAGVTEAEFGELKIEDIAKCYVEGTADYEDDPEAKAKIDELNREIYAINAEDKHDTALARLYWRGRELSYDYFKDFYGRIGVHFDRFYPESTVAGLGLEIVLRELANGVYEKSDGAVVFNGEKFGLHTRVFVNKLGVPTYESKDVGLIFKKDEDYHFDKSVVITGNEQLDYMKVVLKSVEQYAPELVEKTTHLTHGLVKLPGNEKMSSRKGNFLKAVDVLELVREALKREYQSDDWRVALGAVKYAFIKYKMGGDIIFDPAESVKMTGNSGPYLLYSCVRAKKILAKAFAKSHDDGFFGTRSRALAQAYGPEKVSSYDFGGSLTPEERKLVKKILEYKSVLAEAVEEMAPHKVAGYLYELAQEFSRFYEKCPVAGSENMARRVKMVEAYLRTMEHGLGLMGIEIPEEM